MLLMKIIVIAKVEDQTKPQLQANLGTTFKHMASLTNSIVSWEQRPMTRWDRILLRPEGNKDDGANLRDPNIAREVSGASARGAGQFSAVS
jgi:hypothetical protein